MNNLEKILANFLNYVDRKTYIADGDRCLGSVNSPVNEEVSNETLAVMYVEEVGLKPYTIQELIDKGLLYD
jgi:hypothetical protein